MDISNNLKKYREKAGLTQEQLSQLTGIAAPNLRKYESGRQNPKLETVENISKALGINFLLLLDEPGGIDEEKKLVEILRAQRVRLGLTPDQLSDRAGLSLSGIKMIESLNRMPNYKNLKKITDALDLDIVIVPKKVGDRILRKNLPKKSLRELPEFKVLEQRVTDLENERDMSALDKLDNERELERLHQLDEDMAAYEEAGWGDDG